MIEARFDDLTGAEPSFRMVGPAGVLEARRPDEVPGVLAAAEQAAARGLWAAGFVAYEAATSLDPSLRVRAPEPSDPFAELPLAWFAMFEGREETVLPEPKDDVPAGAGWQPSTSRSDYDTAITRIRQLIAAGETYQVNYTLRLRARLEGDARGLYRDLCYAQRGAYGAYIDAGAFRVLSASPELFFRIDGDRIRTTPMKGTAPRGRWLAEDEAIRERLEASLKDQAENAMIVDLLRNDIGRIAKEGTVVWHDVFAAERYETVWQLTSTVEATVRPDRSLLDVFRALFPCGSVTGAPKVSTMGIIADLEQDPRGVYCGTVGYLAPAGAPGPRARFNVAIRTVVADEDGHAVYGTGGGITWDSQATAEYDETVAKARVLTARRPAFRLIETLAHNPETGYRRLAEHMARLRDSATYFGIALDEGGIERALAQEAARFPAKIARVRLLVDHRGQVESAAAPIAPLAQPVRLAIDRDHPVDPADPFLFHKTTLRSRYEDAAARFPDADDVVLVNTRGEITETTRANLAVKLDGRWVTPSLDCGLLPGCERAALLADGTLREATVAIEAFEHADEIAFLGSTRGWYRAERV